MTVTRIPSHDLKFLAGTPVVYHCHHFNLFLDQTVDDALGEAGFELRRLAARRASAELLTPILAALPTPVERIEKAKEIFSSMGHGKLNLTVSATGGEADSHSLHYGVTWREKYGSIVTSEKPVDAFAAGFVAAATALAFGLDPETMDAEETECLALRNDQCRFAIKPGTNARPAAPPVTETTVQPLLAPSTDGIGEAEIAQITDGLNTFLSGVQPDDRGLIQAFGVYVTLHLANYYNEISFAAAASCLETSEEMCEALEDLLRESGHVCVFNTFWGILVSPEWEGLVGPPRSEPEKIVIWCLAIARALGFGRWSLERFEPGKEMVLSTPNNYESVYYRLRHQSNGRPVEYFFQGAALAIMQLAHRVVWEERPVATEEGYARLFVDDELPFVVEQTESASFGDARSVVTVRAR